MHYNLTKMGQHFMARKSKIKRLSQQRSLGQMISTAVFAGMGAWLLLEAASLAPTHPQWQVWGLVACAVFCELGALRFVIAGFWTMLKDLRK